VCKFCGGPFSSNGHPCWLRYLSFLGGTPQCIKTSGH
jgi:hypothetical protein